MAKINYINTPLRPCGECGGIIRFPVNKKCVACVRRENAVKTAEKMKKTLFVVEQPITVRRDKERKFMKGVKYE